MRELKHDGERIVAAVIDGDEMTASRFLIAAGAWSDQLLALLGLRLGIHPVRGQIVLFNPGRVLLQRIVPCLKFTPRRHRCMFTNNARRL